MIQKSFDFKRDEIVYYHGEQKVIHDVHYNPLLGLHQISFKGSERCFSGEQEVKRHPDEPRKSISEILDYYETQNNHKTLFNTVCMGHHASPDTLEDNLADYKAVGVDFFTPTHSFVEWLIKYANGRFIVEVGSGPGHLLKYLNRFDCKVMGIEPNIDQTRILIAQLNDLAPRIHVVPKRIEDCENLLKGFGQNVLVVIAQTKVSDFVEDTINIVQKGVEVLYVNNYKRVEDVGKYLSKVKVLKDNVTYEDKEAVAFSIIK